MKKQIPSIAEVSRRRFLKMAGSAGGAMLLGPNWLMAAEEVDPRVAKVVANTIGIDHGFWQR
jgi:membrane dipeptidase